VQPASNRRLEAHFSAEAVTASRGFDRSARVLTAAACQVGDPLSEAVCWNGIWLLVISGELPDMTCRRLQAGGLPEVGVETLLSRAVKAADAWAPPRQRAGLTDHVLRLAVAEQATIMRRRLTALQRH
jgi:hypothetical protein